MSFSKNALNSYLFLLPIISPPTPSWLLHLSLVSWLLSSKVVPLPPLKILLVLQVLRNRLLLTPASTLLVYTEIVHCRICRLLSVFSLRVVPIFYQIKPKVKSRFFLVIESSTGWILSFWPRSWGVWMRSGHSFWHTWAYEALPWQGQ